MVEDIRAFIQNFHQQIFEPERLMVAIAAIVIVTLGGMVMGALGGNAKPFFWRIIDLLFGKLGARMDKPSRKRGDLIFRGFILSSIVLAISYIIGRYADVMVFYFPDYSIIEIVALCLVLTSGAIFAAMGQLYKALNAKKVTQGAYYVVARSTRTDLSNVDDFGITRVGMGLALKSFDKGIVAPIVWFLLFGLAGAYLYAGIAALSWRFGKNGYSRGFGEAAVALEKLIGFVPNILSGVLIAFAGLLTPTAGMSRAFLGLFRTTGQASYGEGGLPMTAAAYSLNVSLGGPVKDLDGYTIKQGWIGPKGATAQLNAKHLHRIVYISFMAHLLFLVSLSGAMLYAG